MLTVSTISTIAFFFFFLLHSCGIFLHSSPAKQDTSPSSIFPPFISPSALSISPALQWLLTSFLLASSLIHLRQPVAAVVSGFGFSWTHCADYSVVKMLFVFCLFFYVVHFIHSLVKRTVFVADSINCFFPYSLKQLNTLWAKFKES